MRSTRSPLHGSAALVLGGSIAAAAASQEPAATIQGESVEVSLVTSTCG
jgi:hypothetical protein